MKRKTNISVLDNRGIRVTPNMIVGEEFNGYSSGDILDANAVISIMKSDGTIIDLLNLEYYKTINITLEGSDTEFSDLSKQQVSQRLGISESEVDAIYNGRCDRIAYSLNGTGASIHILSYLGGVVDSGNNSGYAIYGYYIVDGNIDSGEVIEFYYNNDKYDLLFAEM